MIFHCICTCANPAISNLAQFGLVLELDERTLSFWKQINIPQYSLFHTAIKAGKLKSFTILTMHWSNCDQEGSSPEARPTHHAQTGWASRVSYSSGWRGVKFLLVGQTCVRARSPCEDRDRTRDEETNWRRWRRIISGRCFLFSCSDVNWIVFHILKDFSITGKRISIAV